jgi:hypothetical protein
MKRGIGEFERNALFKSSFKLPNLAGIVLAASFCGQRHKLTFVSHHYVPNLNIDEPILCGLDNWALRRVDIK